MSIGYKPEYRLITRPFEGIQILLPEDIKYITDGEWEIIYFYVDKSNYVLQLKR